MSIHKSLKLKENMKRSRNVMGRGERIEFMKEKGTWKEGRSIYGLPKTRVRTAEGK